MRWASIVPVLLLGACEDEPSFEERYEKAQRQMSRTAQEIDGELRQRREEAHEAQAKVAEED